jgi:hypothetical protein
MYCIQRVSDGFRLLPTQDGDTGAFLCWPTLEQAEAGFKFQQENYDIGSDPDEEWEIVDIMEAK